MIDERVSEPQGQIKYIRSDGTLTDEGMLLFLELIQELRAHDARLTTLGG